MESVNEESVNEEDVAQVAVWRVQFADELLSVAVLMYSRGAVSDWNFGC